MIWTQRNRDKASGASCLHGLPTAKSTTAPPLQPNQTIQLEKCSLWDPAWAPTMQRVSVCRQQCRTGHAGEPCLAGTFTPKWSPVRKLLANYQNKAEEGD
ncbi:uncharacterized [Tachysurus ichikawai]